MATYRDDLKLVVSAVDNATGVLTSLRASILGIGAAYLSLQGAQKVVSFLFKTIEDAAVVQKELQRAVENSGQSFAKYNGIIDEAGKRTIRMTGVSDELYKRGVQIAIQYGADVPTALRITSAALDLAKGRHIELESAVDILSKAYAGNTSMLSRYGIVIDDTIPTAEKFNAVMLQINQRFGGQAQDDLKTFTGQWKKFIENIGEGMEESGLGLAVPTNILRWLNVMNDLRDQLGREGGELQIGISSFPTVANIEALERFSKALDDEEKRLAERAPMLNQPSIEAEIERAAARATIQIEQLTKSIQSNARALRQRFDLAPDISKDLEALTRGTGLPTAQQAAGQQREDAQVRARAQLAYSQTKQQQEDITGVYEDGARDREAAERKAADAIMAISSNSAHMIVDNFLEGKNLLEGIWKQMASDFLHFFADTILKSVAESLAPGIVKILGSIFDQPSNDAKAMEQGRHFAQFFIQGAEGELRGYVPSMAVVGFGGSEFDSGMGNINQFNRSPRL